MIIPGEEISATYISDEETLLPFQQRQALLLDVFGFVCACTACARGSKDDESLLACKDVLDACVQLDPENLWATRNHHLGDLRRTLSDLAIAGRYGMLDVAWTHVFEYYAAWEMRSEAAAAAQQGLAVLAGKFGWDEAHTFPLAAWAEAPDRWERWGCMLVRPVSRVRLMCVGYILAGGG